MLTSFFSITNFFTVVVLFFFILINLKINQEAGYACFSLNFWNVELKYGTKEILYKNLDVLKSYGCYFSTKAYKKIFYSSIIKDLHAKKIYNRI